MSSELERFFRFCEARSNLFASFRARQKGQAYGDISSHYLLDVFELLYMLGVSGIDSGTKLALVAQAHNSECERLMTLKPSELTTFELTKSKVADAMFSEKNIKKLEANYTHVGAIDQSDVARFLFKHMSRETVRKIMLLFANAELVTRIDAGSVILIKSNGAAERLFQEYLDLLMRSD